MTNIPKSTIPIFYFFLVNRDRKTILRYQGHFVPRVGDKLEIGGSYLEVVEVVIQSAQSDGEGVQHSLHVHVQEADVTFDTTTCKEVELAEFCGRMR